VAMERWRSGQRRASAEAACPAGMEGGGRPSRGRWVQAHLILLYSIAFWSQFKPSEPFLVDYLVDSKGFTNHQVFQLVFPLYVYSRMPFNALVGVLSELPRFGARGVLAAGGACGLLTAVLTRFTAVLWCQQAAQFTVAAAFASRYALSAVAFTLTPPSCFQRTIFTVRAVLLLSNCCSALLGEVLRDNAGTPLSVLFDIDLVSQSLTFVAAMLLVATDCLMSSEPPLPSEALRSREWLSVAEVAEAAMAPPPPRPADGWAAQLKAPMRDLWLYFRLRCVVWWTVWALAMNSAHGIALTYWQNLLREKGVHHDHNGYLLASMYLAASVLTAVTRHSAVLRGHTSVLVVGSVLSSGLLLCLVVASSRQLAFYCWLLLFQCGFEVMTAVSTFQVGALVTETCTPGRANSPYTSKTPNGAVTAPRSIRLTLLFSTTGILCGATETTVQAVLNSTSHTMEPKFLCLGVGLGVLALLLVVARGLEELLLRRRASRRRSGSARVYDVQAAHGINARMTGAIPQVPLLPS